MSSLLQQEATQSPAHAGLEHTYFFKLLSYCMECCNLSVLGIFCRPGRTSLVAQTVKCLAYNVGDLGSIPGSGRYSGEGNGTSLQYSCLENPMDRGALWATVHGVPKSLEIGFCGFKRKEFKILKPQNTWIYSGIISICIK